MNHWTEWFQRQLLSSAEAFEWGFKNIPPAHQTELPPEPQYLGLWSPARHVWHVTEYERCLALPSMQAWLGGPLPGPDAWKDDDAAWDACRMIPASQWLAQFREVRQQQITLLRELEVVDWDAPRETGWGPKPLSWVVSKTFQHTYEHGDTLMRMGLWWDDILEQIARWRAAETMSNGSSS